MTSIRELSTTLTSRATRPTDSETDDERRRTELETAMAQMSIQADWLSDHLSSPSS